ncbi:hypothetical protein C8A03DRAFT_43159 [Achaetomium macrosporum]|uniref:Uncharacterized protein n=1 Tax=Achaetomium macrosporum TaxID=79813 RepID=A0AAN7CBX1_9PEZI|nr:hypothetical protein C8A03DRAFT_43159 [Achaetomium macrosporum]
MPRQTYTVSELLSLRGNQASGKILAMAANPELADIIRRSGSESSSGSSCKPVNSRHKKDDSSVTSEELVFKGTVNRRMGRELAREVSQNSIRLPTRHTAKEHVRVNSQDPARDPDHGPSHPMEWKYRGRSQTEAATAEPIPAPSGAPAQRDEGFQRFYKAVVSPTHVRVTAGGRIVPNTRGPPSPTSKRSSDHIAMENQSATDKAVPSKPLLAPIGIPQPVPIMPQLVTGIPPGFPIQAPVSFVPMAFGPPPPPGFSFAQPAVSAATMAPLAPDNTLKDMHNTKTAHVRSDSYAADDKQGKAKMPAAEPFDSSKPFFYNGQLMYPTGPFPAPLANPMVPVQMLGIPHGLAPLPGQFMQPQPTSISSTATGPSYAPSNTSLSGIPPVVNHIVPANANFNAGAAPPISSIKLSDITKKQIASFKQNLKYHEDQLQYNRHQIDEKDMENRIQILKGHIQRFEATLKAQLEYEEAHRKATQGKEDKKPSQTVAALEVNKPSSQPTAAVEYKASDAQKQTDESVNRRISLASYGLNTNIGESGKASFRSLPDQAYFGIGGLANGQSLPSEAALAPIFQPRGYASTWTGSKYAREMKAYENAEKRLAAAESKSMEHLHMSEQRSVSQPFAAALGATVPRAESSTDISDTASRSGKDTNAGKKKQSNYGVPYLLGTLPKGVDPRTARDQDYVYKRPLTDEERRARFLYWGKAPKSAVKGLPKFDGKHFYPPSPVKKNSPQPARDPDNRTSDSSCDPFRPMTPVQRGDANGVAASEEDCRLTRTVSFETQVNSGSEDFIGVEGTGKSREGSMGADSLGSADRRGENSSGKLWETVLKKGATSSALSATTAQGLLPHYTGHAAASLGPSLTTNQSTSSREVTPGKMSDVHDLSENGGALLSAAPGQHRESCPLNGVNSLEGQFKNLAIDVASRGNLTSAFSM